ncbi:hydrophobic/amphiphilic exporter-1, HAE1 family [Lishizhenia tianjinensis]|uniref:Hydrophobic/amphiphilic exporter-1, HAE1 family n=1 Tax=Lishizhenia tianjinensis TaxID=477690 RepID=A0A1I6XEQ2_9FLAO|nr:efflux RND transporter permease subunit [Lishizhenia tianjinensis]SFT36815.1 hydrophobic/amphiphilic exporter-1, HAE1 family [Lishizhenia tianjinensis]
MFQKFIQRPVLSTVISILIVILGVLGLMDLPVSQYPEIAPPTVQVTASYPGASADVVLNSVVVPLEEQINGVENMTYMTSSATNNGTATIQIYFEQGTDPDLAAVNVQNRVSRATSLLPQEVTQSGVTTSKQQSDNILIFALYSESEDFDEVFVQNYAEINLIPAIKRVNGVGSARSFGEQNYSMRIWLKPDKMKAYGLVPADVFQALAEQNIEAAPGQFGQNGNQAFQYVIRYTGKLKTEKEFDNIVLKYDDKGQILMLKDVARVELGSQNYTRSFRFNGNLAAGIAVAQTAGSNAQEVIDNCLAVLDEASMNFPEGIKYAELVNANDFLDESISKVISTLLEAFVLVFIVVFLFLQDFRSTLIPAIAVPVAIIGTFFFLNLFGFSLNLLTLFALVLAIGIVVDDAIVVVEAVHAKMEETHQGAKEATLNAMDEISGAIISITLVMAAVFVPVTFISGSAGVFYKQFGITLAIAIIISAVNALTLSPALCAIFLKSHDEEGKKKKLFSRFYTAFNASFDNLTNRYGKALRFFTKNKWIPIGIILAFTVVLVALVKTTPTGFVPKEDTGTIFCDITLPPSSSLERSEEIATKVDSIVQDVVGVRNTLKMAGNSIINGQGSAYGMVIIKLDPWGERDRDLDAILGELWAKVGGITDAQVIFFPAPTIRGFGFSSGFTVELQDRTGKSIDELSAVTQEFIGNLNAREEIQYATTSFKTSYPQFLLSVNVPKAMEAGLTVKDIMSAMQGYYGGVYASNFNRFGKQYRIMVQSDVDYRKNIETLDQIYVRNKQGEMAPIKEFISMEKVYGPEAIKRFNLYTSVNIQGAPNEGYSSGDAIQAISEEAQKLPPGYSYDYSGATREELSSGGQSVYIFMLCVIFVYFLLSAQYESYILPLAVILSLPVGLAGSFILAYFLGVNNNIYLQISLIMLIGLLAKNAILIVEFALQRRRSGVNLVEAAIMGAKARLRPIIMTSFAFIFGLVPLILSTGAGAIGNKSIATGAIGGMLLGTILGVLVIPILFVMFQYLQEKITGAPKEIEA